MGVRPLSRFDRLSLMGARVRDPKIVVLTREGKSFGLSLLARLRERCLPVSLIVVERTPMVARYRMARFLAKKIGIKDAVLYNVQFAFQRVGANVHRLRSTGSLYPDYSPYAEHVVLTRWTNSAEAVSAIADVGPDLILLGQSGIVREPILSLPRLGTLNSHPALLPKYRGVDVVAWTLWHGDPLGVTVHFADQGVDTGPIIAQRKLELQGAFHLEEAERLVTEMSLDMLVEVTEQVLEGKSSALAQRLEDGK
ncbi:MAG: formyl transferase, partial [Nitrospinota bacterium]